MYKRTLICTILFLCLLFISQAHGQETAGAKAASVTPAIGSSVPAAPLSDLLGRHVNLGQYIGRVPVVLIFWSIHCNTCVNGLQFLQGLEDRFQGVNIVVMAVNEDADASIQRIRRFTDRLEKYRGKITYPLLYDDSSGLFHSLGISTLPALVIIDRKGNIASYFKGFNPEDEPGLADRVNALASGVDNVFEGTNPEPGHRTEYFTVTGEAALCGFFDSSGWRKSFSGNESLPQEMELTRDLARRSATRQAVTGALQRLGIEIYSREPSKGCLNSNGIQLGRDPFDTRDPTSNFLNLVNYDDFIQTIEEQEMLIDRTYYVSRRVKVNMDRLKDVLGSLDYLMSPLRITVHYVNADPMDQKWFLDTLLANSRYVGKYEPLASNPSSMTQIFDVYTSSQGFADEILDIDFGRLQVFVEEVTPTSLELEMWE